MAGQLDKLMTEHLPKLMDHEEQERLLNERSSMRQPQCGRP